jgi:hypothetical protein
MDEFLRSHPLAAWVGAGLAFVVFVILLLHMVKILFELRRRLPSGERSRQLRLGFVENFDLDGERQLLLVRRDNVEHLLLIGGPNDVLVESGIVRTDIRDGRLPRGGFEPASQAAPPAPSGLVLSPPQGGAELAPPPAARPETPPSERPEGFPLGRPDVSPLGRLEARNEPKPASQGRPKPEPAQDALPELNLEDELKAALEASPFAPPAEPALREEAEPPPPPPQPPQPERLVSRFAPPPRPSFRAPLPPRTASPSSGAASSIGATEPPTRPRFVIPPLARRASAPPPPPVEPPPAPIESAPDVESAAHDLFGAPAAPKPQAASEPPAPEPSAPPRQDSDALDSLEEEMAKLLGRPTHKP